MRFVARGSAPIHSANLPDSPRVTVVFGGVDDEPADVGMVIVQVPPGAGMPAHRHNGSDIILTPTRGSVRVVKEGQEVTVTTGDALLITKEESVGLTNPGTETAELIVAAGPPAFVSTVSRWPRAQ